MASDDDAIDQEKGTVNLYKLCPNAGDSLMVVNYGTHFGLSYHSWDSGQLKLTAEDLADIKGDRIIWQ